MRARALVLPLLVCLACGAEPSPVELATAAVARGDLERAEALLPRVEDGAAGSLRKRIEGLRARRAEVRGELAAIHGRVLEISRNVAQRQIEDLLRGTDDPVLVDELERALSGLAEHYAKAGRTARLPDKVARAEPEPDPAASPAPATRPPDSRPPGERPPARESEFDPYDRTRRELVSDARARVSAGANVSSGSSGLAEGGAFVEPAPEASAPEDPRWDRVAPAEGAPRPEPAAVRAHVVRARTALSEGRLADARDAFVDAAANAVYSIERDELAGLARDVEDRIHLRDELAAAFAADVAVFESLGVTALDAGGVEWGGDDLAWRDLDAKRFARLFARFDERFEPSLRARLGWFQERLVRGDVERTWRDLADLVDEGRVSLAEASGVVGRHRGEYPPPGGYVLRKGDFLDPDQLAAVERAERVARAASDLRDATADERDALVAALLADDARDELQAALEARWNDATGRVAKDRTLGKLQKVADARKVLDAARATALELIFDEEEYFYPYRPPECPPERAKDYPAVQRRVTELVGAVEDAWSAKASAELNDKFRAGLDEVAWGRARQAELGVAIEPAKELPAWLEGIDPALDEIGLAEFAWDADERLALAHSRAVRARNERLFVDHELPDGLTLDVHEMQQVRITNDYRVMFGRRAVAWNPRIHAACEDHSAYMSRTGNFGHFQPENPDQRTPNDRMRRRGYDFGISENCAMGGGDPMGAHVGWTHSSGHHRNLLIATHREMASALGGPFWTQDFGQGTDFLAELPEELRDVGRPPGRQGRGGIGLPGATPGPQDDGTWRD